MKNILIIQVNSEGPDKTADACRIIRTFSIHLKNILIIQVNSDGLDKTANACRMIRAFAIHVKNLLVVVDPTNKK